MVKTNGRVQKQKVNVDVTEPQGMADKTFNDVKQIPLRAFVKGNVPWNKGLKTGLVPKTAWKKGCPAPSTAFAKGHIPWHAGKKVTLNTGRTWFGSGQEPKRGEQSNLWKGGIAGETKKNRAYFYLTIRPQVLKRDNYTCQICGETSNKFQVDHIKRWSEYPELRFNVDNCRTLCTDCHKQITFKHLKEEYAQI